jgi:hypothetical protein
LDITFYPIESGKELTWFNDDDVSHRIIIDKTTDESNNTILVADSGIIKPCSIMDTENGVIFGDEINLVEPGFNSGWNKIDGIWSRGYPIEKTEDHVATNPTKDLLVDFNGKGK